MRTAGSILYTFVVVLGVSLVTTITSFADESRQTASTSVSESQQQVDPAAREVLKRAADFLRAQPRFAFSAEIAYEVLQDDGGLLEFGELRRYIVRRPDKVRIDAVRRAGGARNTYFDGERITVTTPDQNAYAFVKLKQHRSIDDALHLIRDRLGNPMPLGELLASDVGKGLEGTFDTGFLVGDEKLDGHDVQHAALGNEHNDIELWVRKGPQPFVVRVHIAYHTLPGEPRFSARLFDWTLSPDVADSVFRFDPPPSFERVRFAFGGSGTPPAEEQRAEEKKP
jgi:hypothetical protein